MTTREVCALCGAVPEYRMVDAGTFADPAAKEKVAWRCSNASCENHNPDRLTFEWARTV